MARLPLLLVFVAAFSLVCDALRAGRAAAAAPFCDASFCLPKTRASAKSKQYCSAISAVKSSPCTDGSSSPTTFSKYCSVATQVTSATAESTAAVALDRVILLHKEGQTLNGERTWCALTYAAAQKRAERACDMALLKTAKDVRVYRQWKHTVSTSFIANVTFEEIRSAATELSDLRCQSAALRCKLAKSF